MKPKDETKMTAVEWLINELKKSKHYQQMINEVHQNSTVAIDVIEQAKEMEKEQIITSWHNGYENQSPMIDENNCGQQYYNEQFKNK